MTPILDQPRQGDFAWLRAAQIRAYAESDGFDASFGDLVGRILDDFEAGHDPRRAIAIIPRDVQTVPARPLGSIFCLPIDENTAQLRLFYVVPEMRGQGLAQRLLDAVLDFAHGAGYRRMTLWTHSSHVAAGRLYARNGFERLASQPVHHFGKNMVQEHWSIAL